MRQAGLKPKSHNSGIYWTRTQLPEGSNKVKKQKTKESSKPHDLDLNGNGQVEWWEILAVYATGWGITFFVILMFLLFAAKIA